MILVIGLAMIIAGWAVQVYKTLVKKNETLNPIFLLLYVVGVGLLFYGNFLLNNTTIGTLNLISFLVAITLTITIIVRRKGVL